VIGIGCCQVGRRSLKSMIMSALDVAGSLGYVVLPAAVAVESAGVPVPGEATLIAAAVLAANGKMQISAVICLAAAGAIVGDNVGFLLGRRLGRRALVARGPARRMRGRALDAGRALFARYGGAAVFVGRFVTFGRVAVAWLAGAERLRWRRFAAWNAAGSVAWAAAVGGTAFALGTASARWLAVGGLTLTAAAFVGLWRDGRARRRASSRAA
jgi:membrane protein DedA with SNARE-associated domain